MSFIISIINAVSSILIKNKNQITAFFVYLFGKKQGELTQQKKDLELELQAIRDRDEKRKKIVERWERIRFNTHVAELRSLHQKGSENAARAEIGASVQTVNHENKK